MEAPSKKYFTPTLYPLNKDIRKTWFIKYFVKDYTAGKLKPVKYYGQINKYATAQARIAEAEKIIQLLNQGIKPANVSGQKKIQPAAVAHNFASVVYLCENSLKNKQHEVCKKTVSDYASKIRTFKNYLEHENKSSITVGNFTKDDARAFIQYLKNLGLSNKTCNDYKSLLASIFSDIIETNDLPIKNVWQRFKGLKEKTQHFKSWSVALENLYLEKAPAYSPQLYLYSMLIYYCFIRPGEIRQLKIKHLQLDYQAILIESETAKNSVERLVKIPDELFKLLQQYGYCQPQHPEYFLFSSDGKPGAVPAGYHYFRNLWNEFKKLHSIPAEYKLYGLKHTGNKKAGRVFSATILQKHNRHSSLQHTQSYTNDVSLVDMDYLAKKFPAFGS